MLAPQAKKPVVLYDPQQGSTPQRSAHHELVPSDVQMSTQEDTLMSDINVAEGPPTPEPHFNSSTSSPTEENRSPEQSSHINETDGAMQGVVTEKAVNPETMGWLNSSPDIKVAENANEQIYSSDSQKHKPMRDFDNVDENKPLKA